MSRYDVYEYILGDSRVRIVIVSSAGFNPRRATYALLLGPDPNAPRSAALVATLPADGIQGIVDVTRLRPLVTDNLGARVGRLSRTTMGKVDRALATYLGLYLV